MLDDVLHEHLVEGVVLERIGELVEVVDDVGVGVRRDVEADRPRPLLRAAADVEHVAGPGRAQVELPGIGEAGEQFAPATLEERAAARPAL